MRVAFARAFAARLALPYEVMVDPDEVDIVPRSGGRRRIG
jgi:hypothetical protein